MLVWIFCFCRLNGWLLIRLQWKWGVCGRTLSLLPRFLGSRLCQRWDISHEGLGWHWFMICLSASFYFWSIFYSFSFLLVQFRSFILLLRSSCKMKGCLSVWKDRLIFGVSVIIFSSFSPSSSWILVIISSSFCRLTAVLSVSLCEEPWTYIGCISQPIFYLVTFFINFFLSSVLICSCNDILCVENLHSELWWELLRKWRVESWCSSVLFNKGSNKHVTWMCVAPRVNYATIKDSGWFF